MKVLLDENIDVRFKAQIPADSHEVYTVRDMQWNGIKNGVLLQLLTQHKFDCWIVVDKNIPYQQNPAAIPCLIVVLDVIRNTLKHLVPLVPAVLNVLNGPVEKKIVVLAPPRAQD